MFATYETAETKHRKHAREAKMLRNKKRALFCAHLLRKSRNLDGSRQPFLLRVYLRACKAVYINIIMSWGFEIYMLCCITLSIVLIGVETYPHMYNNFIVTTLEKAVVYSFLVEFIMNIMSEGKEPFLYFIGPNCVWNNFDFIVLVLSLLPFRWQSAQLFRLIRLIRSAKLLKRVHHIEAIVMGLAGEAKSVIYVVLLMVIAVYFFTIAGMILFKDNDPLHFGGFIISVVSVLRLLTLDDWGDIMYINYFGCDQYPASLYTSDPHLANDGIAHCGSPYAQPAIASAYFIGVIFCCTFTGLSLFVGGISTAIGHSLLARYTDDNDVMIDFEEHHLGILKEKVMNERFSSANHASTRLKRLVTVVFGGLAFHEEDLKEPKLSYARWIWKRMATHCADIIETLLFRRLMMAVTFVSVFLFGVDTNPYLVQEYSSVWISLTQMTRAMFLLEVVIKVVANDLKPWKYFNGFWDYYNLVVVLVLFVPTSSWSQYLGTIRFFRVAKLVEVVPQFRSMIESLLQGLVGVGFIGFLLLVVFYLFTILGMILFSRADPFHFGSLTMGLITMMQCVTLDGWSAVMTTSLQYCRIHECKYYVLYFGVTILFWTCFVIVGNFVVLTLFIGVVTVSMELTSKKEETEKLGSVKAAAMSAKFNLSSREIGLYKEVFHALKLTHGRTMCMFELEFGLAVAGIESTAVPLDALWANEVGDKKGIDEGEFIAMMATLKMKVSVLYFIKTGRSRRRSSVGNDMRHGGSFNRAYTFILGSPSLAGSFARVMPSPRSSFFGSEGGGAGGGSPRGSLNAVNLASLRQRNSLFRLVDHEDEDEYEDGDGDGDGDRDDGHADAMRGDEVPRGTMSTALVAAIITESLANVSNSRQREDYFEFSSNLSRVAPHDVMMESQLQHKGAVARKPLGGMRRGVAVQPSSSDSHFYDDTEIKQDLDDEEERWGTSFRHHRHRKEEEEEEGEHSEEEEIELNNYLLDGPQACDQSTDAVRMREVHRGHETSLARDAVDNILLITLQRMSTTMDLPKSREAIETEMARVLINEIFRTASRTRTPEDHRASLAVDLVREVVNALKDFSDNTELISHGEDDVSEAEVARGLVSAILARWGTDSPVRVPDCYLPDDVAAPSDGDAACAGAEDAAVLTAAAHTNPRQTSHTNPRQTSHTNPRQTSHEQKASSINTQFDIEVEPSEPEPEPELELDTVDTRPAAGAVVNFSSPSPSKAQAASSPSRGIRILHTGRWDWASDKGKHPMAGYNEAPQQRSPAGYKFPSPRLQSTVLSAGPIPTTRLISAGSIPTTDLASTGPISTTPLFSVAPIPTTRPISAGSIPTTHLTSAGSIPTTRLISAGPIPTNGILSSGQRIIGRGSIHKPSSRVISSGPVKQFVAFASSLNHGPRMLNIGLSNPPSPSLSQQAAHLTHPSQPTSSFWSPPSKFPISSPASEPLSFDISSDSDLD